MIWASWCSSCVDNIVAVRDMKKKGLLESIQFVSISVDEDKEKWENFLYQYDMKDYMNNLLMGRDSENILNNFRYKEMINSKHEKVYNHMTPAYCLVKDGSLNKVLIVLDKIALELIVFVNFIFHSNEIIKTPIGITIRTCSISGMCSECIYFRRFTVKMIITKTLLKIVSCTYIKMMD